MAVADRRTVVPAALAVALAGAGLVVATTPVTVPGSTSATFQIWSDLARDVNFVGLSLTQVSAAEEQRIGDAIAQDLERFQRPSGDEPLDRYVANVGRQLVAALDDRRLVYRFRVVNDRAINAFAIPGGHIYITTGFMGLLKSEAELAAVLGHEISHVSLRHCIARLQYEIAARRIAGGSLAAVVGLAGRMFGATYNASQETDADLNGMLLAAKAGYDPKAVPDVLQILVQIEGGGPQPPGTASGELSRGIRDTLAAFAISHPSAAQRIADAKAMIARNRAKWQGESFYVGSSNLAGRLSKIAAPHPDEWVVFGE